MTKLRFMTAGESHGQALVTIVEGLPAGLPVSAEAVDRDLTRRQAGYGRGGRMKIERDQARILAGVRHGRTIGSPVAILIENRDWPNWRAAMAVEEEAGADKERITAPRPGHADLAGGMKYGIRDLRAILERSSARETAARVAAGAVSRLLLGHFGVSLLGMVAAVGGHAAVVPESPDEETARRVEESPFRCPDPAAEKEFVKAVDEAAAAGDSLGGVIVVRAGGVVPGIGSHVHWDRRLDARLAGALMSIPAIKGVEFGLGFRGGHLPGSRFHDPIEPAPAGGEIRYRRRGNNAGGLEGGITTGEPIIARLVMKPIPTLGSPLDTVDIDAGTAIKAHRERSDVCAVPAAAVVAEAMTALVLADGYLEKFGGDSMGETVSAFQRYRQGLVNY